MNELAERSTQLPDTLEDLSQFVLVNKAKLDAYRVKLRAVNRLSDAQGIREQTLQEMQDISSALIAAETRIGEILLSIPKQTGNQYTSASSEQLEKAKSKSEVTEEMGYTRHEVSDYQRMAQNPAIVNLVLERAEREGRVVSHTEVMRQIKEKDAEIARLHDDNKILARRSAQEPIIMEKPVEVKVFPDDYEQAKKSAEIARKDFARSQKQYEEMAEKWKKSEAEKQKLIDEKNDPKAQKVERAKLSASSLVAGVSNFLEKFGGYSYLMGELDTLSTQEKKMVDEAVKAMYNWSNMMLNETVAEEIE